MSNALNLSPVSFIATIGKNGKVSTTSEIIVKMIPAVPMGNCYKLRADGECLAILPTEKACDLFIKQLPNTSGQIKEWTIELNWIPGLAF